MIAPDAIFRPSRDVRFRIVDNEAIVLRQEAGEALVLNDVGAEILQLLDGTQSVAAVLEHLHRTFDAESGELEADCHQFIDDLARRGVLTQGNAPERAGTP